MDDVFLDLDSTTFLGVGVINSNEGFASLLITGMSLSFNSNKFLLIPGAGVFSKAFNMSFLSILTILSLKETFGDFSIFGESFASSTFGSDGN